MADPSPYEFDLATAVRPTGDGVTFDASIDAGFTVVGKPNGGYLVAIAARASGLALGDLAPTHQHALASTAHYLAAPDPGPAQVHVTVLRAGRSASQVRTELSQDGKVCVETTFTMGVARGGDGAHWWSGRAPLELAPFDGCTRLPARREGAPFEVAIMDRVDLRLDPADLGFARGEPSGRGELRGWISFADGRPMDPLGLLFMLDAFPPATLELAASGWVPTLSLTAYVRAQPTPGPLRVSQRVQVVDDGRLDEVCEAWDSAGRLVAHATQYAAIRFSDEVEPPPSAGR